MISVSPLHRRPAAPWAAPDQLMAEVVGPTPEFWEVACSFSGLLWFSSSQYVTITTHITIISIIITTYSRVERLQVFFGGFFDSHHLSGDLIPVPRKIETQNKRFESFKLRIKVVQIYTFWCSGFSTLPFLYSPLFRPQNHCQARRLAVTNRPWAPVHKLNFGLLKCGTKSLSLTFREWSKYHDYNVMTSPGPLQAHANQNLHGFSDTERTPI